MTRRWGRWMRPAVEVGGGGDGCRRIGSPVLGGGGGVGARIEGGAGGVAITPAAAAAQGDNDSSSSGISERELHGPPGRGGGPAGDAGRNGAYGGEAGEIWPPGRSEERRGGEGR